MRNLSNFVRRALAGYEPVAVRGFVTSVFAALALGGFGTGELPAWVEMALALLAVVVPTLLAFNARAKVTPTALVSDPGKLEGDVDLHPEDEPDVDDPDDDLAPEPGQHRAEG